MKVLQFAEHGDPTAVVELVDAPEPPPPTGDGALLEVVYSPINPFDLNMVRGRVPVSGLPSGLGTEGVGRVLNVGNKVTHVRVGDLVLIPSGSMAWRERMTVSAKSLFALPESAAATQLAIATSNPVTAGLLLDHFAPLGPGDWVIQNAGNSAVAASVVAFAHARDLHVVSLVRRDSAVAAARDVGADAVLVDQPGLQKAVMEATGGAHIRIAFDGVGGEATNSLAAVLAFGGTVVAYSAMSGEAAQLKPAHLIFRDISLRGIFLGHPQIAGSREYTAALREGLDLITSGALTVPLGSTYPLEQYREAFADSRNGKKTLFAPEASHH